MATKVDDLVSTVRETSSSFYLFAAIVFLAVALGGFARTYVIPVATAVFDGPAVLHVHAALFFAWMILLAVQSRLAERRRIDLHRTLGFVGVSLATAMVFSAVALVARGLDEGIAAGNGASAKALAIVPLSQVFLFAGFFVAAVANVRRPETHKRLMLVATVNLLPPAIARVLGALLAPGRRPSFAAAVADVDLALMASLVGALVIDLLIVLAIVRDWRVRGRPHRVYVIGLGAMLLVHVLRIPVAQTPPWHAVADILAALGG